MKQARPIEKRWHGTQSLNLETIRIVNHCTNQVLLIASS